jgi:hypothetical protein
MSLCIDIDKVREVLLEDGWHTVVWDDKGISTFDLDSYEYIDGDDETRMGGGDYESCGIPALGFMFRKKVATSTNGNDVMDSAWIKGPVSSIKAVKEIF